MASYGGVNGVDASRACRRKSSKNGCRNRTPIPYTNRRELISGDDASSWEVDFSSGLVDLSNLKHDNHGTTFLLTAIDVFTKVAWCVPLKNKSASWWVTALKSTLTKGWPKTLQTYKGLEFLNRSVQSLLKKYGIHHLSTHNEETKVSIVERFNRTLKTRMWRYCDETPDVAIQRRPSGRCAVIQRPPPPPQHR